MALTLFSSVAFSSPAVSEANSAPRETIGYDSSGVIVKTENSPIVVDKEDLTFHIYSADRFIPVQEYVRRGTVTAEYTFRNPTQGVCFLSDSFRMTNRRPRRIRNTLR